MDTYVTCHKEIDEEMSETLNKRAQSLLDGIKIAEEERRLREQLVSKAEKELVVLMSLLLLHDPDSPLGKDETYLEIRMKIPQRRPYNSIGKKAIHDFELEILKIFPSKPMRTFKLRALLLDRGINIPFKGELGILLERSPFFYRVKRGVWDVSKKGKAEIRKTVANDVEREAG